MNRTRLIWFAAGAAVSALATLVTQVVVKEPAEAVPYLTVAELSVPSAVAGGPVGEEAVTEQTLSSGAMLRECGATNFLITQDKAPAEQSLAAQSLAEQSSDNQPSVDQAFAGKPYAQIAISSDTLPAIQCILARAAKDNIPVNIKMITDRHAQTH